MYQNWQSLIRPKGLKFEDGDVSPTYGKFVASPLERGFGITLGNALRRVLLSSLQGAAITGVRFENVLHEFSTLPGIKEDVAEILLNLKELKIKLHETREATVKIDFSGEKTVKARDLNVPSNVEILNPDQHIVTLSKEGKLKAELTIKMGKGYVTAEQNKEEGAPIGVIPMDSIFSPILRVNYNVTNARVGQRTDYDRLSLEVWTDGSVTPEAGVALAAKVLKEQLQIFINFDEEKYPDEIEEEIVAEEKMGVNNNLYRRVDELELSVRSANCLANANIQYLGELVQKTENEMLKTKNFGRKSLNEIKEILTEMGLGLGMQVEGFSVVDAEKMRPKEVE